MGAVTVSFARAPARAAAEGGHAALSACKGDPGDPTDARIGTRIAEKYDLLRVIGRGGWARSTKPFTR